MIIHHDQDAVFTGYEWARRLVLGWCAAEIEVWGKVR